MNRRRVITGILLVAGGILACWVMGAPWFSHQPAHDRRKCAEWSLDLLSPSHSTRAAATRALQSMGPDAVPLLVRQLHRRESWLRSPVLAFSSRLPVNWRRAFIGFWQPFRARDERLAAATALALFGAEAPVDPLLEALRDPDRQLASRVATALGGCGAAAVPGLTAALQDPDPEIRRLACYALSQIRRPAAPAAAHLAHLLSDSDFQLMASAAHALTTIGPAAIPHFIQALDHPEPRVREKAAFSLSQFRSSATNAVPALERLVDDEDAAVRWHADLALRAIVPRRFVEFGARHPSPEF
ncbi:MAG: HEAT repeat domain-containing protein [Verrucomicrobia bacterium]|nr:HEAT repeat domain-containing protein [Verrucomicrobiota bacterium]